MIVGERLKQLRKDRKVSAEELGKVLEITRQQVQRYETNKTDVTSDVLVKMAEFFGVSVDYLVGIADHQTPYYTREPNTLYVEVGKLLRIFSPEIVGRLIKSLGFKVVISESLDSNKRQICVDIPDSSRS